MSKYLRDKVLLAAGTVLPADGTVTVDVDLWGSDMEIIHAQARVTWGAGADSDDGFEFRAYALHGAGANAVADDQVAVGSDAVPGSADGTHAVSLAVAGWSRIRLDVVNLSADQAATLEVVADFANHQVPVRKY
ncbi:MAG: hypothetical protein ACOX9R_19765 [Armatimonadota bacterium]|jgi:hypothetical protein